MTTEYLDRAAAAVWLADKGIPTTPQALDKLAFNRKGPPYALLRGRAYYTPEGLTAWLREALAAAYPPTAPRKPQRALLSP
jgi:hypothetical protein